MPRVLPTTRIDRRLGPSLLDNGMQYYALHGALDWQIFGTKARWTGYVEVDHSYFYNMIRVRPVQSTGTFGVVHKNLLETYHVQTVMLKAEFNKLGIREVTGPLSRDVPMKRVHGLWINTNIPDRMPAYQIPAVANSRRKGNLIDLVDEKNKELLTMQVTYYDGGTALEYIGFLGERIVAVGNSFATTLHLLRYLGSIQPSVGRCATREIASILKESYHE